MAGALRHPSNFDDDSDEDDDVPYPDDDDTVSYYEPDDYDDEVPYYGPDDDGDGDDDDCQRPDPFAVCVVARSRVKRGVGYLGFREGRFYRPVYRTCPTMRFLACDLLDIGGWYDFPVLQYPDQLARQPRAEHPHAHEDTLVARGVAPTPTAAREREHLFNLLRPVAKDTLEAIFGDFLRDGRACYVDEGTVSASVGVLRCRRDRARVLQDFYGRPRVHVDVDGEVYEIPLKEEMGAGTERLEVEEEEEEGEEDDDPGHEILLLLELGKPFDNPSAPPPARCYFAVIGYIRQYMRREDGTQRARDASPVRDEIENLERVLEDPEPAFLNPEQAFTAELLRRLAEHKKYKILPRARYEEAVATVRQSRRNTQKEIYCNKRYEVRSIGNTDFLIKRRQDDRDPVLRFLCAEDIYAVVHQLHAETEHGRVERMYRELRRTYANITREVLLLFLTHCERCVLGAR